MKALTSVVCLFGIAAGACGGGGETAGAVVGIEGGAVLGSHGATVVIPAGALAAQTTIRIEQTSAGAPALPVRFASLGQMFAFTPHGTTFAIPVTVTVPFDAMSVPAGVTPVLYKTSAQHQWQRVATVTVTGGVLSAQVTSFSHFQAGGPPLDGDGPPPPSGNGFRLGGTVTGLAGRGLILTGASLDQPITGNGPFAFAVPMPDGVPYDVRVKTQPTDPNQVCVVSNGRGTIAGADVGNLAVDCTTAAVNGALDATFGLGGVVSTAFGGDETAMALQPDGKILMAGGSATDFVLARYNADGSLDTSFGNAGLVTTDVGAGSADEAHGLAIQADGKIVVVGQVVVGRTARNLFNFDFAVARYHGDGTPDASFGAGGKVTTDLNGVTDRAFAVAIQADGKIVVAGDASFDTPSGVGAGTDFGLVRYSSDGRLDPGFGTGGKVTTDIAGATDLARNLALLGDGAILVSGSLTIGSSPVLGHTGLARYHGDGSLDAGFAAAGKLTLSGQGLDEALAVQGDGKIVLAGSATVAGSTHFALMRLHADGSSDAGFGTAGLVTTGFSAQDDVARAVALQPDGKIVVAGQSSNRSNPDFAAARYHAGGTLDLGFGTDGKLTIDFFGSFDGAENLVVQPDGKVVLGGHARNGTRTGYGLARLLP